MFGLVHILLVQNFTVDDEYIIHSKLLISYAFNTVSLTIFSPEALSESSKSFLSGSGSTPPVNGSRERRLVECFKVISFCLVLT